MTALATAQLPLLAAAPNGIRSLRALILDLAVRGRLCEQDPTDLDAAALLARLKSEQVATKLSGKRRGATSHGVLTPEPQFRLPNGWHWATIGDIAEVVRGVTYGKADARDEPDIGLLPLLRGNNINGTLNFDKLVYVPAGLVSDEQMVRAGDLVIAMSSGSADLVGKAAQAIKDFQGGFGAFCGVVRPKSAELHSYLGFFFQTPFYRRSAAGQGKGIGINNLQKTALQALSVPLPSLAEQHRIVAKVDELMALCDRLEAEQAGAEAAHAQLVQALLASLTQARDAADFRTSWQQLAEHFHTLFTTEASVDALKQAIVHLAVIGVLVEQEPADAPVSQLLADIARARSAMSRSKKADAVADDTLPPFEIPRSWTWIRLGEMLSKIGAGSTPLGGKQAYVNVGVKFLRSQNVWNDGLRLQDVALISPETHARMAGTHVQSGDILFNITGASIGRCALVPDDFDTGNVSQHVTIIRPLIAASRKYLHLTLTSKFVQDAVMAVQVGVSREGLSIGKLAQFYVPLPPLAEQHRIVAKVTELLALCDQLKLNLAQARQQHEHLASVLVEQAVS